MLRFRLFMGAIILSVAGLMSTQYVHYGPHIPPPLSIPAVEAAYHPVAQKYDHWNYQRSGRTPFRSHLWKMASGSGAITLMGPGSSSSSPTWTGDITANSIILTGTGGAGNGSVQITSSNGYIYFNNQNGTTGIITSNMSAASAGATSATAMIKIYPQQVLDATDYVFSIGPQGNGSSLFNVAYNGTANFSGSVTTANNFSLGANASLNVSSKLAIQNTAPTISSGFGTSPSIASSNGTAAFTVNVGTGGVATSGVIGLPTATNGWVCRCDDITTASATVFLTKQTASATTTCTVGNFNTAGAAAAWVASDILHCTAMGR